MGKKLHDNRPAEMNKKMAASIEFQIRSIIVSELDLFKSFCNTYIIFSYIDFNN